MAFPMNPQSTLFPELNPRLVKIAPEASSLDRRISTTPRYRFGELNVELATSTQYATIFAADDKPAGTFRRRRVFENGLTWTVYDLAGKVVCETNLPREGLRRLMERRAQSIPTPAVRT
jgi:hypothetical protein